MSNSRYVGWLLLVLALTAFAITQTAAQENTPLLPDAAEATAEVTSEATAGATAGTPAPATPVPIGGDPSLFITPEFAPIEPLAPLTLPATDARLAACAAPTLDGFAPYLVGYNAPPLHLLLLNIDGRAPAFTPAQIAALNCLDDAAGLPVGAVLYLPANALPVALPTLAQSPLGETGIAAEASVNSDAVQTVSWRSELGARLQLCAGTGETARCADLFGGAVLPESGAFTFGGFTHPGTYEVRGLFAQAGGGAQVYSQAFSVTCAQPWLGVVAADAPCPQEPGQRVFGAYQPFENGAMLWFSDTNQIYVFRRGEIGGQGTVQVFPDTFVEGMPDLGIEAPQGLIAPVRGFGRLWLALGGEDSGLGYATAPETGLDTARQPAGSLSYTTYVLLPDGMVYAVTEIPGQPTGFYFQLAVPAPGAANAGEAAAAPGG